MKITVTTLSEDKSLAFNLDVHEDLELENLKALCELESNVPASKILLVLNGRPLRDHKKSLKELGLTDGDLIILHVENSSRSTENPMRNFDFSSIEVPSRSGTSHHSSDRNTSRAAEEDPAFIRDQILASPEQLSLLKQNNPPLADALLSGDFDKFSRMVREMQHVHREKEMQRIRLLTSDSMDVEAQRLIEAEIRQKQVDANMEAAMEFSPESFGTVCMLYINCKVNGIPVKAFIDSGAQTTIMSTDCAERCKIMRLVDTRFSGIAKGVGIQKILGRIHMVQIQIGSDFFVSSFSILEDQKMDMLLGLDMLKRHQCVIDLQRNVLKIGTTGTETSFLPESELPETARLTQSDGHDQGLAKAIEESVKDLVQSPSTSYHNDGTTEFPEQTIQEIIKLGFSRHQVIYELKQNNGDKTQAIAALFAKSLKF